MKRLQALGLSVTVAASAAIASCGSSPTAPVVLQPLPALTSLTVSGNVSFTAPGQTSKLTATGHYSDGSTKDVSTASQWLMSVPSVVTVSTNGTVTTVGLGSVTITALSGPFFQSVLLTVTPPGTFAISGWVREPGVGPLGGAHVVEASSGTSADTQLTGDFAGTFALGGLTNGHLTFTKDSFEDAHLDVNGGDAVDIPLQHIMRIAAGDSVSGQIAPHDLDYLVAPDTHCGPCKLIRVTGAAPTLHFHLAWTDKASLFNVWINGQMFPGNATTLSLEADAPAGPGELLVYVAKVPTDLFNNHVAFTFSTTK